MPTRLHRCAGTTKKGKRCRIRLPRDFQYCHHHRTQQKNNHWFQQTHNLLQKTNRWFQRLRTRRKWVGWVLSLISVLIFILKIVLDTADVVNLLGISIPVDTIVNFFWLTGSTIAAVLFITFVKIRFFNQIRLSKAVIVCILLSTSIVVLAFDHRHVVSHAIARGAQRLKKLVRPIYEPVVHMFSPPEPLLQAVMHLPAPRTITASPAAYLQLIRSPRLNPTASTQRGLSALELILRKINALDHQLTAAYPNQDVPPRMVEQWTLALAAWTKTYSKLLREVNGLKPNEPDNEIDALNMRVREWNRRLIEKRIATQH